MTRKENEHLATLLWEGRLLKTHGLPCSWIYEIRDSFYRTPLISLSSTNCPPHFSFCYTRTFLKYNMHTWSLPFFRGYGMKMCPGFRILSKTKADIHKMISWMVTVFKLIYVFSALHTFFSLNLRNSSSFFQAPWEILQWSAVIVDSWKC